jgi:DNA polymerase-3 subunit beta
MANDLEVTVKCKTDLPDGLYDALMLKAGFVKPVTDMSADDFPQAIEMTGNPITLTIEADDLAYVSRAMSKEETRYYLCGICVSHEGLIATDGHRLHMIKMDTGIKEPVIIRDSAIKYAVKEKGDIIITLYDNGCRIQAGDNVIESRYIDGTFPDYRRVIPDRPHKTVFKASDFKQIGKDNNKMRKAIGKREDCFIRLDNSGTGKIQGIEVSYPVSCQFNIEDGIGFNVRYLSETGFDGSLSYHTASDSIMVDNGDKTAVLMPVRL